jgi:hypothetical protein
MKKNKYSWVDELDADELRNALYSTLEEQDDFKKMILGTKQLSHVELIKNTKGVNVGVKSYHEDVDKAKELAEKIFDELSEKYEEEIE